MKLIKLFALFAFLFVHAFAFDAHCACPKLSFSGNMGTAAVSPIPASPVNYITSIGGTGTNSLNFTWKNASNVSFSRWNHSW